MRRRVIPAALALIVLLAGGLLLVSCGGDDSDPATDDDGGSAADDDGVPAGDDETGLANRTLSAGAVDVEIEPRQLDDQGAVFVVTLDTHSEELSMDLAAAELEVAGDPWPVAGWDGDGPSGHHREGELSFEAGGAATGTARLTLPGFPEPVEVTWELGG